jgi:hypothetical protein
LLRQVLQLTTFDCRLYLSISSSIGLKMMEIETIIEMLDANLIDNHKFVRLTVGFCDNLNNWCLPKFNIRFVDFECISKIIISRIARLGESTKCEILFGVHRVDISVIVDLSLLIVVDNDPWLTGLRSTWCRWRRWYYYIVKFALIVGQARRQRWSDTTRHGPIDDVNRFHRATLTAHTTVDGKFRYTKFSWRRRRHVRERSRTGR